MPVKEFIVKHSREVTIALFVVVVLIVYVIPMGESFTPKVMAAAKRMRRMLYSREPFTPQIMAAAKTARQEARDRVKRTYLEARQKMGM